MKRFLALLLVFAMSITPLTGAFATGTSDVLPGTERTTEEMEEMSENDEEENQNLPASPEDTPVDGESPTTVESDTTDTSSEEGNLQEDNGESAGEPEGELPTQDGNGGTPAETPETSDMPEDTVPPEEEQPGQPAAPRVRVFIREGLPTGKDTTFTVSLQRDETTISTKTIQMGTCADFTELTSGTYTVQITAPEFETHKQEVPVEAQDVLLDFYTDFLPGYAYEKDSTSPRPGVLRYGDFSRDGKIDDEDVKMVIDLLEEDSQEVSLADLEILARRVSENQRENLDCSATAVHTILNADVRANVAEGTIFQSGKKEDLASGNAPVQLARKDGKEISSGTPLQVEFSVNDNEMQALVIRTPQDNPVVEGHAIVTYQDEDEEREVIVPFASVSSELHYLLEEDTIQTSRDTAGIILIDLGKQVAVKKVTICITRTQKNPKLAEITSVEFLNNMEERIPAPATDVPENLGATPGSEQFILYWDACVNVAGYEVEITNEQGQVYTKSVKANTLLVASFNNGKIINNTEYTVRVRAVNGEWKSGYCKPCTVVPVPSKRPDAPDNLRAVGAYRSIQVSWKKMKDTDSYNLYYRREGETEFTKIPGITANSYTLTNLNDQETYVLYVTGVNDLGESAKSLEATATTTNVNPAHMPQYGLLNQTPAGEEGAALVRVTTREGGMVASAPDTESGTALGTADKDPSSYYEFATWDSGGYNAMGAHGVTFEFDKAYKIQTLALTEPVPQSPQYGYARVAWTDENGKDTVESVSIQRRTDSEGRPYYWLRLAQPVTTSKLRISLARAVASGTIAISEVNFYHYDPLESEILALYTDDLHTVLRSDVTQNTIDALRTRIQTPDASGECHPDADMLEKELATAEEILQLGQALAKPVTVYNTITTSDVNRGFGGLNAWQPLGVTAAAGEKLIVYVGHSTKKTGENTNLQLVATQYHAESSSVASTVKQALKVGRNEIIVPTLSTLSFEAGGAIYVQYTGRETDTGKYAVRVSGGVQVPVLDLYRVESGSERLARAMTYVAALDSYCAEMRNRHNSAHSGAGSATPAPDSVRYEYDEQNCILGASDILMETMLVSLPAQQILNGLGSGSVEERAQKLVNSMDAMEAMMDLFYQHKGLNPNAKNAIDQYPRQHLNIRYQRMFAGAFMYAAGNHIGIEWGSVSGVVSAVPVKSENGKYQSGNYFGWGIAHEIGHCINQGAYAIAEVTNNYFSVLAQAKETNASVRFSYENVYKKVTSGEKGRSENVFTQLGLYWQLHLAYDNGYNYTTYANHSEQLQNLFFARVDSYARTPANAPKPGGVALTLSGGTDQSLMRLACAAAEKDLLEFFERWGMEPDADTTAYARQFEKETRAIYYGTDEARVYRLTHEKGHLSADGTTQGVGSGSTAEIDPQAANTVVLRLSHILPEGELLGYEIVRCTTEGGQVKREPVGFATSSVFRDCVTTLNNRVVFYEVTAVDQFLNRSAVMALPPVKIEHHGYIDKTGFTVQTEQLKALKGDVSTPANEKDPCAPAETPAIRLAVDDDSTTVFEGTISGEGAAVTLTFNRPLAIEGFSYSSGGSNAVSQYTIRVRGENGEWLEPATGSFTDAAGGTVYFGRNGNIASYTATAVQFVIRDAQGTTIHIAELDVLGVTGDNVDWKRTAEGEVAIGTLSEDYTYADGQTIPKGSTVFTGIYKGNPAYNVVLLYDQNGNVVGGTDADGTLKAQQIILADVPPKGNLRDVREGIWIYWVEPGVTLSGIQEVRAELYRVDDAHTNEGQRLVSDSLPETMPRTLPPLTLSGGAR